MTRSRLPAAAFLLALGLAVVCLAVFGAGTGGTRHALEITARFSYLWFWPAYAGGALAWLAGSRFRYGREFGLAFVAAHSIHVILVLWLYRISATPPISLRGAIFFSIGVAFMYLLAILSIRRVAQMLDPRLWRLLLLIGMEYIEFAFLKDFRVDPFHPMSIRQLVAYLPFMLIGLLGTAVRLLRWLIAYNPVRGGKHAIDGA